MGVCLSACMCREGEAVTAEALEQGLQRLGYRLDPSEVRLLTNRMRQGEEAHVRKSAFLASQIDWAALLEDHRWGCPHFCRGLSLVPGSDG